MRELIQADWYRVRRSGLLAWMIGIAGVIAGVFDLMIVDNGVDFVAVGPGVPGAAFVVGALVGCIACGIRSENDFVQGSARNKVVTGHTRAQMFWASYTVSTIVTYLATAVFLIVLMVPVLLWTEIIEPDVMRTNLLQAIPLGAAFTALYSLVGVLWTRRGTTAVNLVVLIALFVVSGSILGALLQPEFHETVIMEYGDVMEDGDIPEEEIATETVPNPNYVREPDRSRLMFFNSALPTGQVLQLTDDSRMSFLPPYALGFAAVCIAVSLLVLRRRNLQ